ncbi:MAG: lactate utilization protein B, partial [Anaerolineales bacterium]
MNIRDRIREKVADPALQAALDGNAEKRVRGRSAAFASLPDWPQRRQRAHAVRAEVIANLDSYLAQFIRKVEGNGIRVHRASDAAEAVAIVLDIVSSSARQSGGALVAKSKSMVSEEIELNHALEAAGHRVVETDLGEYIIQLRGERPSHIITPAVHLRRHEVGQLFAEKLGIPYTEDIPTLTNTARRVLRQVFLTADVGISGVNFGVAETGTLTLVTNEGNGRMVTTLPPVHIALMGMERLLPTLDDLALFLSLLPRSATGQKLSVYTQLIHAPEDVQQKHLVIVDNGREAMRQGPLREALYCIRCGACLNACPVFREIGGHAYVGATGSIAPYPGPIGSVVSPGLLGGEFAHLAQASTLCGACKDACPVDIDLPMLLTRVRAGQIPAQSGAPQQGMGLPGAVRLGLWAYARAATRPALFGAAQKAAGLGAGLVAPQGWLKLPVFTGWGFSKDMPRPAAVPFRERWKHLEHRVAERAEFQEKVESREIKTGDALVT